MPKIKTIFKHLEPSIYKGRENLEIRCVVTDSRLVQKGDLFIAQKGANVDSHRFINDVLEKGAYVLLDTLSALSDPWKNQKNPSIFFCSKYL
jgi:UDP-N-acetylmuramoyl-L-alanyl-D-glutamate--2,6-diaminopimelate ligase